MGVTPRPPGGCPGPGSRGGVSAASLPHGLGEAAGAAALRDEIRPHALEGEERASSQLRPHGRDSFNPDIFAMPCVLPRTREGIREGRASYDEFANKMVSVN